MGLIKQRDPALERLKSAMFTAQTKYKVAKQEAARTRNGEPLQGAEKEAALEKLRLAYNASKAAQNALKEYENKLKSTQESKPKDTIKAEIEAAAKGEVYTPKTDTGTVVTGTDTSKGSAPSTRNISKEQAAAPKFIYDKSNKEKEAIAAELTAAGYPVPNWRNIEDLVGKYQQALSDNANRNTNFGINQTLDEFINTKKAEQVGSGAGGIDVDITVSSESAAASTIQSVVKGILKRDATPEEITNLTKALNKAERSAGKKTRKIGGRTEYTTDLDRVQFLTEEVKKIKDPKSGKSEFEVKQGEKESLTSQELMAVARANGIDLGQDQLNSYLANIRNGKDLDVVKNDIRAAAGLGRPDNIKKLLAEGTDLETIYAPYRRTMATILELDPASIDINDSTLQTAIGDKELPIYEFRKVLKKDPRWQYTNNAREEVSNLAVKVLRDFGFQG